MAVENLVYPLQQAGAILITILLIYLIHQWIRSSIVNDESMRITLKEVKAIREEARERSMHVLSRVESLNNLEVSLVSNQKGLNGNKLQSNHVKYPARTSNAVKESKVMSTISGLKPLGNAVQDPFSDRR